MESPASSFVIELKNLAAIIVVCLNTLALAVTLVAFGMFTCLAITGDISITSNDRSSTRVVSEEERRSGQKGAVALAIPFCFLAPIFLAIDSLISPYAEQGAFNGFQRGSFGTAYLNCLRGWAEILVVAMIIAAIVKLFSILWRACKASKKPDVEIGEAQGEDLEA